MAINNALPAYLRQPVRLLAIKFVFDLQLPLLLSTVIACLDVTLNKTLQTPALFDVC